MKIIVELTDAGTVRTLGGVKLALIPGTDTCELKKFDADRYYALHTHTRTSMDEKDTRIEELQEELKTRNFIDTKNDERINALLQTNQNHIDIIKTKEKTIDQIKAINRQLKKQLEDIGRSYATTMAEGVKVCENLKANEEYISKLHEKIKTQQYLDAQQKENLVTLAGDNDSLNNKIRGLQWNLKTKDEAIEICKNEKSNHEVALETKVQSCEAKNNSLGEYLKIQNKKIEEQIPIIDTLKAKLENAETRNALISNANIKLEEDGQRLINKNNNLILMSKYNYQEIDCDHVQNETIKARNEKIEEQIITIDLLGAKLENAETRNASISNANIKLEAKVRNFKKEQHIIVSGFGETIKARNKTIVNLNDQLEDAENVNYNRNIDIKALGDANVNLHNRIEELTDKLKGEQSSIVIDVSVIIEARNETIEELTEEIETCKMDCDNVENMYSNLEMIHTELKKELAEAKATENRRAPPEAEISRLNKVLVSKGRCIEELKKELKDRENQILRLAEVVGTKQKSLDEIKSKTYVAEPLQFYSTVEEALAARIKVLERNYRLDMDALNNTIKGGNATIAELEKANAELKKELMLARTEQPSYPELNQTNSMLRNRNIGLKKELETAKIDIDVDKPYIDLKVLREEAKTQEEYILSLKYAIRRSNKLLGSKSIIVETLERKLIAAKSWVDRYGHQVKDYIETIESLNDQVSELGKQVIKLDSINVRLDIDLKEVEAHLKAAEANTELKKEVSDLADQLDLCQKDRDTFREWNARNIEEKNKYRSQAEAIEKDNRKLENQTRYLREQRDELKTEIIENRRLAEKGFSRDNDILKSWLDKSKVDLTEANKKIEELERAKEVLRNKCDKAIDIAELL